MKKLLIGIVILAVLAVAYVVYRLHAFSSVEPMAAGECRKIEGVAGAEDLTIDPNTGIAYISSVDWRGGDVAGAIFGYDLTVPESKPFNLTPFAEPDFRPHGIGLWASPGAPGRLMVVSHPKRDGRKEHEIVVFEALGMALRQVNVIADPTPDAPQFLLNPNDIIPVDPGTFYVTNDHTARDTTGRRTKDILGLGDGNVVYFDGAAFTVVADGLNVANGINVSPDGSEVYVASSFGRSIGVYGRDEKTGALTEKSSIGVPGGPDNIERTEDGSLLVGLHPNLFRLYRHAQDQSAPSPGRVVQISWEDGEPAVSTIHADDGSILSGISVAARYGNRLLIGSIFMPYFLDCTLDS